MKNTFKEYYRLTNSEIDQLWDSALFVFDTNVLLNFYRYSESTVEEFVKVLKKLKGRIWLPHQVGREFHKRRLDSIGNEAKTYSDASSSVRKLLEDFSNKKRNPFLSSSIFAEFSEIMERVQSELNTRKQEYDNRIKSNDDILDYVSEIFENVVGENYSHQKLNEIHKDGAKRYAEKIPPGYEDRDKTNNSYGDLIIWFQIIDKAKKDKLPIVFVTDDKKKDWWLIAEKMDKTVIGPRPELCREFFNEVGENFHIYEPYEFLEIAKDKIHISIEQTAINEVKELTSPISDFSYNIENEILISILLEETEPGSKIEHFVDFLKSSGCEVFIETFPNSYLKLMIPIPDIPGLGRRIKRKYISRVEEFGFKLIEIKPDIN